MSYQNTKMKLVADIFNGKTPSRADQRSFGYPVLKIRDVDEFGNFAGEFGSFVETEYADRHGSKKIHKGDVLILNAAHSADYVGTKVYSAQATAEGALATGEWLLIRPNQSRLDARFLYYWVTSTPFQQQIREMVKGIHLYPKDVAHSSIPLPPLEEQRRIAAILDTADTLRTKRRQAIAKLDTLLQSTFLTMFGDPVTNPMGWEVRQLQDVCTRITDGTHQSPAWAEQGVPFLFVSNVVNGELDFDTKKQISMETYFELNKRCPVEVGDILYTIVGSYGNAAMVETNRPFSFQRHIAHLKPDHEQIDRYFLLGMMQSPGIKRQADAEARGVAQKTLNLRELKRFEILFPPKSEQLRYRELRSTFLDQKRHYEEHTLRLGTLFNSLQQRAFRGDL